MINQKMGSSDHDSMLVERRRLPVYRVRQKLLHELRRHTSLIIIGETGSGKTTQIPQFIFEAHMQNTGVIAITQPRRVAAITVAQRVAQERGIHVGHLVGYNVRFDDSTSPQTKIKYMTDGMLLREAILDPDLKRYSVVILDEAHERTVHTDVLFGVVKTAQKNRKLKHLQPLKVIVMSATMDVDHFSQYFNNAAVVYLEGRQFPIQIYYAPEPQCDYVFAAMVTVFQIHKEAPPDADILLFLTGQEEIDSVVRSIREISHSLDSTDAPLLVLPLYASLPAPHQLKVFTPAPQGTRKVIVSTNIAETSVTIKRVKFVIDCGMVKARMYSPTSGLDMLRVVKISKAQALQRTGRAGRESPGICYRLYTEHEFDRLKVNTVPEILRCNLASVILQLIAMGVHNIPSFDFLDKPSPESLTNAIEQLHLLGAVEKVEHIQLTDLGREMSAFPLDPRLSKVLIMAQAHHCLEEMLSIVSTLSVDTIFFTPQKHRETAIAARQKFISSLGDHITLLNVYRAYKGVSANKQWCYENYLNARNLNLATEVRRQLRAICVSLQLDLKSCGQDLDKIRKCLVMGFFMNSAQLHEDGIYYTVTGRKPVFIHPSSSLCACKPAFIIYNELIHTTKSYMRDICVVDPDWLYASAPTFFKRQKHDT